MAEERPLSLQTHNINSVPPNADHSPSIQSAPAGRQSTLNSAVRRRPSLSPKTMSASHLIQDNPSQKKTRAGAQKARETSRSSNMQIPDMEITYTPTTHRISKAKKGKKVHACEFPGCNKVFTPGRLYGTCTIDNVHRSSPGLNIESELAIAPDHEAGTCCIDILSPPDDTKPITTHRQPISVKWKAARNRFKEWIF